MSEETSRPTTALDDLEQHQHKQRAQTAAQSTTATTDTTTTATSIRPITTGTLGLDNPNTSSNNLPGQDDEDALRDRLIEDLDYKRRRLKVQGDIAAEDTAATGEKLKGIHGDNSILVNAARDAGLFGDDRVIPGRMAEETFAHELRELADQMGVPDWLKEADLAMKLREKAIASKITTRELMDKVGDRATVSMFKANAVPQNVVCNYR